MEMYVDYVGEGGTNYIHQREQTSCDEIRNRQGGYTFSLADKKMLERFLILGDQNETVLKANIETVDRMIMQGNGVGIVETVKKVSKDNRGAHKSLQAMILAVCARCHDFSTKEAAYNALNKICTNPSDLMEFINYCQKYSAGSGWGRMHKRFISKWYNDKAKRDPMKLLFRILKFRKRKGWSHRDVFRKSHIKAEAEEMKMIIIYCTKGFRAAEKFVEKTEHLTLQKMFVFLRDCHELCRPKQFRHSEESICQKIKEQKLHPFHISNWYCKKNNVWVVLMNHMSLQSLLRNLGCLTVKKVFDNPNAIDILLKKFENVPNIKVHPFQAIIALINYEKGYGFHGAYEWKPNKVVCEKLNTICRQTFKTCQPTKQNFLIAVDVSNSMDVPHGKCYGCTTLQAGAALAWTFVNVEPNATVLLFSNVCSLVNIKHDTLHEVLKKFLAAKHKGTDCSLPIKYAIQNKLKVDVFVVVTDSETYDGHVKSHDGLYEYRRYRNKKDVLMFVIGMRNNKFSIADPQDPYMIDIPAFDKNTFQIIVNMINSLTNNGYQANT